MKKLVIKAEDREKIEGMTIDELLAMAEEATEEELAEELFEITNVIKEDAGKIICLDINLTPRGAAVCVGGTPSVREAVVDIIPGMKEVYEEYEKKLSEVGCEFVEVMMKAIDDMPDGELEKRTLTAMKAKIEKELNEWQ